MRPPKRKLFESESKGYQKKQKNVGRFQIQIIRTESYAGFHEYIVILGFFVHICGWNGVFRGPRGYVYIGAPISTRLETHQNLTPVSESYAGFHENIVILSFGQFLRVEWGFFGAIGGTYM